MRIDFLVNPIEGGWEPDSVRLGGTEESIVRWAEELVKRKHKVTVYRNSPERYLGFPYVYNDVAYCEREDFRDNADICINVKNYKIIPKKPTLYLTNETMANKHDLSPFAGVIWPSVWADENIHVNNPVRYILPHGYDSTRIYPSEKIPKQCLYASSPDRGLTTLLRAWRKVTKVHPDAHLFVTYGAMEFDLRNVHFMGDADNDTMDRLYRDSDIWCHPANGGELFCMTGIKAQAAGCVPVVIPTMALAETVKHGYFASKDAYADALIQALNENERRAKIRTQLESEHYVDWEESTTRLLEIIRNCLHSS